MNELLSQLDAVQALYKQKQTVDETVKEKFTSAIYTYYDSNYRTLPWRSTGNPYHILISEVMLQQTQVGRVVDKFHEFTAAFPTVQSLAGSSLHDVLAVWQGLGYNRRAKYLWECARIIASHYDGIIPNEAELRKLPGLGRATAASVTIFAYNTPALYIETNVRTVYIHIFFGDSVQISDAMIAPILQQTMDEHNPRKFYNALMDCGTAMKKFSKASRQSAQYKKQAPFHDSLRKVRGEIIRRLVTKNAVHKQELLTALEYDAQRIEQALSALCKDNMISEDNGIYRICQFRE